MAKTKRKQLAALAALKPTSPDSSRMPREEHQDGNDPALHEEPNDKGSASLEIRQQRIIFWIPPLDSSPKLVNSRSFRISGTPRKRKLSRVNEEEKTSSDAEDGHVYKKYAKIILKLDSWNSEKSVDAPPAVDVPLDDPPVYAEKAYQRRKPVSRILCKERVLSVLTNDKTVPASSSVPAIKKTRFVNDDQRSLSAGNEGNANDLAPGETIAREPLSHYSRRLGLRTRKTVSHKDLVSAKPGFITEEGDTTTSKNTENTQEIVPLISRRQKTKSLKGTVPQHEPTSPRLDVASHPEDQRKLRSAEKERIDPGLPAAGLRVQVSKGTDVKRNLKLATRSTALLGTSKIPTQRTNNDQKLASLSDSPSHRNGGMSVDRPSSKVKNSNSRVSKLKLLNRASEKQGRGVSSHKPVARIRKRAMTQTSRRGALSALDTTSDHATLDDYRPDAAVPTALIDPVWNRVSTAVPSVDEPNELHHGSDVVTSSNNAALNSRSRRISFVGKNAGSTEEDLKRVNLGSNGRRENPTSPVNISKILGINQSRAKSGGPGTSLHYQNGDNGLVDSKQLRTKRGGAVTPLHHQNEDSGQIGSNRLRPKSGGALTSLHRHNGDIGYIDNNQLKAKPGRAASSLHLPNGDTFSNQLRAKSGGAATSVHHNGSIEPTRQGGKPLKPQARLHGSQVRNQEDMTAIVRSKLDEVGGLTEWLIGGGLGVFVDLFQERQIQEGDLLHLTMSSLKEIGVQAVGPRRKLIWMIEQLL